MDIWTRLAQFAKLETERLSLRPLDFDRDAAAFFRLASDPTNLPFIFPAVTSRAESDFLLVASFMKAPLGVWVMADRETDSFLGIIRLENIKERDRTAEVGYFISRTVWGQGLTTEALRELTSLALSVFGLGRLIVLTHADNLASQEVAKKAGFKLTQTYKGSDRHSRKTRLYQRFERTKGD